MCGPPLLLLLLLLLFEAAQCPVLSCTRTSWCTAPAAALQGAAAAAAGQPDTVHARLTASFRAACSGPCQVSPPHTAWQPGVSEALQAHAASCGFMGRCAGRAPGHRLRAHDSLPQHLPAGHGHRVHPREGLCAVGRPVHQVQAPRAWGAELRWPGTPQPASCAPWQVALQATHALARCSGIAAGKPLIRLCI